MIENNIHNQKQPTNCHLNFSSLIHSVADLRARRQFHRFHIGDCVDQLNQKYVYLQIGTKTSLISSNIGLCISKTCQDDMVIKQVKFILQKIEPTFQVLKIDSTFERYQFSFNWISFLTILIMTLSITMILVAFFKRKDSKQENKLLKCFDVMENIKNFKTRESEPLLVLDGVRALAMIWVILVHIYKPSFSRTISEINVDTHYNKPFNLLFLMGYAAVDIFLCLGGFFLMFISLREKQITLKYCFSSVFKRISRIWPVFTYVIMVYYSLFPGFGIGANWKKTINSIGRCQNAWKSIFFISNIYNKGQQPCIESEWYLQVDFQLFVTITFLLLIYQRNKKIFLAIIFGILIIVSVNDFFVIIAAQITHSAYLNGLKHSEYQLPHITPKPYYRCLSYLVGVIIGSFYMDYRLLFKAKKEIQGTIFGKLKHLFEKSNSWQRAFEFGGLAIIMIFTLSPRYLQIGGIWPDWGHSLYWVSVKILFPIAVFMLVCPSMLGESKSLVNVLLRSRILMYLARVSYSTFIFHLLLVDKYFNLTNYDLYYNMVIPFNTFCGLLVQSVFCGFVLLMTIQLPFAGIISLAKDHLKDKIKNKHQDKQIVGQITGQIKHYFIPVKNVLISQDQEKQRLYQK